VLTSLIVVNEYEIGGTTPVSARFPRNTSKRQSSDLQCDRNCSSKGQAAGTWHNSSCGVCSLDKCEILQQSGLQSTATTLKVQSYLKRALSTCRAVGNLLEATVQRCMTTYRCVNPPTSSWAVVLCCISQSGLP
jgi:hypothetical protein